MMSRFRFPLRRSTPRAEAALLTALLASMAHAADGSGSVAFANSAEATSSISSSGAEAASGGNDASSVGTSSGEVDSSGGSSASGANDDSGNSSAGGYDNAAVIGGFDSSNGPRAESVSDLYLFVILNATAKGLAHFEERDGSLWASATTLSQLGFVIPPGTPDPVRLDTLPGANVHYDVSTQTVAIDMPIDRLNLPQSVLNARQARVPNVTVSPGMLLDYDLFGSVDRHGDKQFTAFADLRTFGGWGLLHNTTLTRFSDVTSGSSTHSVRLDTMYSRSFPASLFTLNIGDTTTGALDWSRSTRIGGIQLESNFALQPYRVFTPIPQFFGSATVPSDVELYINGVRQYSGSTPAGPFQIDAVPSISGAGIAHVVLTDAVGHTTTLDFPIYATHELLTKGLTNWSAELGVVRNDYGVDSFSYHHDPVLSGTWRHGFSDQFTTEAHAEAIKGLFDVGAGATWELNGLGVAHAAYARSSDHGASGSLGELGYDWQNEHLFFSADAVRTYGNYRDVASRYGPPPPLVSAHANIGYATPQFGNFSLGYIHLRMPGETASRYANASWFQSFGQSLSLNAGVNQNLDNSRDRTFSLSLTWSGQDNVSVSASALHTRDGNSANLDVNKPTPTEGGFGWRVDAHGGDTNGGQAELDYLGRYGRLDAGVIASGDSRMGYAEATGSLVFLGGGMFAARHIDDAFAVVSTDGIPGIPVLSEHRVVGTTNSKGLLLVSQLRAYQDNQLEIDPMALPADLRVGKVNAIATPPDRAGTVVKFGIAKVQAASVTLVDGEGKPLALGTEVYLRGQQGEPSLVGFDGSVYLENLDEHNVLDVRTASGRCGAQFDYRSTPEDTVPQIGPLVCTKEQP